VPVPAARYLQWQFFFHKRLASAALTFSTLTITMLEPSSERGRVMAERNKQAESQAPARTGPRGGLRCVVSCAILALTAVLGACSTEDALIKTSAGYPPVDIPASGLPRYAVGDSFTYDNPAETWTIAGIRDGVVTWSSSLGKTRKSVYDPFVPPIEWVTGDVQGVERITKWDKSLFPLSGGRKIAFRSNRRTGDGAVTPFQWKCYAGNPRQVTVKAGTFAAYPVFCRRSDGFTAQSFYAPKVNGALLIKTRKRPAPATTRELIAFSLTPDERIAAPAVPDLPEGWALAAIDQTAPEPEAPSVAVASATGSPSPAREGAATPGTRDTLPPDTKMAAPSIPPVPAKKSPSADVVNGPSIPVPPTIAPPAAEPPKPEPSKVPTQVPSIAPPPTIAPPAPPLTAPPAVDRTSNTNGATGGFGVQLASYKKPSNAAAAWQTLRRRLEPLLDASPHVVRRVDLGPPIGVVHRIIAGPFGTRDQAWTLCRTIRDRGGTCLVTKTKR
jgi:hypothetical protein